jgi:hypothetical protein
MALLPSFILFKLFFFVATFLFIICICQIWEVKRNNKLKILREKWQNFSKFFKARSQNCEARLLASSRLSVRMKQPGFHWTDFNDIWYLSIFRKSVEKIQAPLKSDKNNGYFTWMPIHILLISRWILLRMRNVSNKSRENQNTHFMFNKIFFSRKSCHLWDKVERLIQPDRP